MSFHYKAVGVVESPYKEKFAIPRQPGLAKHAFGSILLSPEFTQDAVRDLSAFSHIWVLFHFHENDDKGWKALVRPPRLGGNAKAGVFATRSTYRPNGIGMSVLPLSGVTMKGNQVRIDVAQLDLVDGTPILDIKPYIPYSDSVPDANAGFATNAPEARLEVHYSSSAMTTLTQVKDAYPHLKTLIEEVLSQDPRPAYKQQTIDKKCYGMALYCFNIRWQLVNATTIEVVTIEKNNDQ
ncbi:tRNA (N6-threonylcarbamoyladenosine(37)-N6)-methyltransferase TrmO [Thalassotalea agarivorans]|uniref:tRNA-Thr(GGU) m(6)t(6)A37 methyltransferase TsaA n=1 Tax=Thalassotalea agarivorans TaxID=349064 RepID=A0A1I0DKL8_THASX|nr:tRNA (N6-threonylcarbamoyladenosine(37)-N6)-methyltransferase TrmO [Thalassotalea agarivorans]SET33007.1 tRNA-Thr(GGU) m(6)t(6)A37 methyltransferase TsaA [Thalassotalea agarivorans]